MNLKNFSRLSPHFWPLIILLLLLGFNAILQPAFFHLTIQDGRIFGSLVDIILRAAPLIFAALGMTLVIATRGIDLSVGTTAALAAAVAAYGFALGLSFPVVIFLAVITGLVVGLFNSFLIVVLGTQPIIASLIAMVTGRGVAQLLVDGQIVSIQNSSYLHWGAGHFLGLPVVISLAVVSVLTLHLFVTRTSAALFIEAVGSTPRASHFIGLNTKLIRTLAYVICGMTAALAGISISANIRAVDVNSLGLFLELDAILAVVIGGTLLTGGRFSLIGSCLGALIIQTVTTTINTQGIPIEAMSMIKAVVVISICLLQSEKIKSWAKEKFGSTSQKTVELNK